jgi:endonuclease YncB( thermonuclease family)
MSKTKGKEAADDVRKQGLNKQQDAIVVEQENSSNGTYYLGLVLMEEGEEDPSNSLNAYMLAEGLAKMNKNRGSELPEDIAAWQEFEDEAVEAEIGIWEEGFAENLDDDY